MTYGKGRFGSIVAVGLISDRRMELAHKSLVGHVKKRPQGLLPKIGIFL